MCERFTFQIPSEVLTRTFGLTEHPTVHPRYNIASTQQVPTIRQGVDGLNRFGYMHWGLIPSWTKNRAIGRKMINARSETLMSKPAYRHTVQHQRCLVLASGYYNWERVGKRTLPMYVRHIGHGPMVFAGLWDSWKSSEGETVDSCTILTTAFGEHTRKSKWSLIEPHQHRMPVILNQEGYQTWLDRNTTDTARLVHLYRPYSGDLMERMPVSPLVNNLKNDSADLIIPFSDFPHLIMDPEEKDQV